MAGAPPGTPGHGQGLTSIRRAAGGSLGRDPATDEWVVQFEVVCPDCGDNGGPYADQPPAAQAVRGPYAGRDTARAAALEHTGG